MNDPKIEYLESVHKKDAAIALMLNGIDLIMQGGPEGISEVARTQPDTLLQAFHMLAGVIQEMRADINEHVEARFELIDALEQLNQD